MEKNVNSITFTRLPSPSLSPLIRVRLDWLNQRDNFLSQRDFSSHSVTSSYTDLDLVALNLCKWLLWEKDWAEDICTHDMSLEVTGLIGMPRDDTRGRIFGETDLT